MKFYYFIFKLKHWHLIMWMQSSGFVLIYTFFKILKHQNLMEIM